MSNKVRLKREEFVKLHKDIQNGTASVYGKKVKGFKGRYQPSMKSYEGTYIFKDSPEPKTKTEKGSK